MLLLLTNIRIPNSLPFLATSPDSIYLFVRFSFECKSLDSASFFFQTQIRICNVWPFQVADHFLMLVCFVFAFTLGIFLLFVDLIITHTETRSKADHWAYLFAAPIAVIVQTLYQCNRVGFRTGRIENIVHTSQTTSSSSSSSSYPEKQRKRIWTVKKETRTGICVWRAW